MRVAGLDEDDLTRRAVALGRLLRGGDIVLLSGAMGAGKTTFTRALGQGLGLLRPGRVCSPTFNICLVHPGNVPLIHIDLFRLDGFEGGEDSPAFGALGLEPLVEGACEEHGLAAQQAVLVVEWAELWNAPPAEHLRIHLHRPAAAESSRDDLRDIEVEAAGTRHANVLAAWMNRGTNTKPDAGSPV